MRYKTCDRCGTYFRTEARQPRSCKGCYKYPSRKDWQYDGPPLRRAIKNATEEDLTKWRRLVDLKLASVRD
jgi:hypothetical protein